MTKTILLTATALTAIALAGAANAQAITAGQVSGVTVVTGTTTAQTTTPYYFASEINTTDVANRRTTTTAGANAFTATGLQPLSPGGAGTTYRVTYTLGGTAGATFQSALASSSLTLGFVQPAGAPASAGCTPTGVNIIDGGGAGQSSVSYIFTVPTSCSASATDANRAPQTFTVDAPFQITQVGTVTTNIAVTTASGAAIANSATVLGASTTPTVVNTVQGYAFLQSAVVDGVQEAGNAPDNADLVTRLALASTGVPYRALSGDTVIGAVNFGVNTNTPAGAAAASAPSTTVVRANLSNTSLPAASYNLTVNAVSGDFTIIKPATATTDTNATAGTVTLIPLAGSTNKTATSTAAGGQFNAPQNVVLSVSTQNSTQIASTAQTYQAVINPVLNGGAAQTLINAANVGPVTFDLETVSLEGTNFIAPWLQMQSSNYNAIVRISNIGTTATGPVTLALRANNGGTVNTTCTLSQSLLSAGTLVGGGIGANSSIEFSGRTLANSCFGTTSTNADLQVTIQGQSTNLTAKVRIINPDASVSESQLGRLNELGSSF